MNYLYVFIMLALSMHTLYAMEEKDKHQDTRDFNYIPPELQRQLPRPQRLANQIYPQVLSSTPILCADIILLRLNKETNKLEYFMVKRANKPAQGFWWFPGGRIDALEEFFDAAERKCKAEGSITAASFSSLGFYRTRFPDSEWIHPTTGQLVPTDSFNNVVIAFYDPETRMTERYEDAEAVEWVDFDRRPSSLPMPPQEERQGVDVAYLDQAHADAHRILEQYRAEERLEQLIEETIAARRLGRVHRAQEEAQRRKEASQEEPTMLFSFDEELYENIRQESNSEQGNLAQNNDNGEERAAIQQSAQLAVPAIQLPLLTTSRLRQSSGVLPPPSIRNNPWSTRGSDEENEEDASAQANTTASSPSWSTTTRTRDRIALELGALKIQQHQEYNRKGN